MTESGPGPRGVPVGPAASAADVAAWLGGRQRILLLTHERPDGDAIGSLLGLGHALHQTGKRCVAYLSAPPPRRYRFLAVGVEFLAVGPACPGLEVFDAVVCVDASTRARVELPPRVAWPELAAKPLCLIDHHADNELFAMLNWVAPDRSATAQLIFELCRYADWPVGSSAAACLLTGLIMDSGAFQFPNTTPGVLRDAAALMEAGADYAAVMDALYFHEPLGRRRLAGRLLETAKFSCDGRFVCAVLPPAWLQELAVSPADTEGLIDTLRAVDGVEVCGLISPETDSVRVSLRSRSPRCRVDVVAHALGGGGHPLAAGAKLPPQPLAEVEARLLAEVRKTLS